MERQVTDKILPHFNAGQRRDLSKGFKDGKSKIYIVVYAR